MHIAATKPLLAWGCLDDSPDLRTIRRLLALLPDAQLLEALRRHRGKGRNDFPVHVLCYDTTSKPPIQHQMAFIGHEKSRRTLKYRCPAMHQGWTCPNHHRCNAGKAYGKTLRVHREIDLRRFPPIPRATRKFERLYKGRTAVERVNARSKIFWGIDDGNVSGAERFHANVNLVMLVHVGLATLLASCPRREGTLGQTRLSPPTAASTPQSLQRNRLPGVRHSAAAPRRLGRGAGGFALWPRCMATRFA